MRTPSTLLFVGATALALALVNSSVDFQVGFSRQGWNLQTQQAEAKVRSGGRAGGGSFSRPSRSSGSGSSSPQRQSSPSRPSTPSYSNPAPVQRSAPVIVPVPHSNPYPHSSGINSTTSTSTATQSGNFPWWLFFLIFGGVAGLILLAFLLIGSGNSGTSAASNHELDNDTVTVTQLQVAMLAQAREIQSHPTELTLDADTETPEGLSELLQETVLALLRSPENWTHVRSSSETLKTRESAAQRFEQLSIAERSKFGAETLVNVGGKVRRQTLRGDNDSDPAAYIVVTLLVGTADDCPLIKDPIHSTEELKTVLQQFGSISSDYLMIFVLLWSPQDARDSLSYDELLAEYADMIQIA